MKTRVLREYPESAAVCKFVEYYRQHPHELVRCDGTLSLYWKCGRCITMDHEIFKYGEGWCTYERAKRSIRHAARLIQIRERLTK